MNLIKKNFAYFFNIIIICFVIFSKLFNYIIQTTLNLNIGYNAYKLLNISGLGFWGVVFNIFQYILAVVLIAITTISLLQILANSNIIKFEFTNKKISSLSILKWLLFVGVVISFIQIFLTWFIVIANADFALKLGAGSFVCFGVLLVGFVIFLFLNNNNYFKKWEEEKNEKENKNVSLRDFD